MNTSITILQIAALLKDAEQFKNEIKENKKSVQRKRKRSPDPATVCKKTRHIKGWDLGYCMNFYCFNF